MAGECPKVKIKIKIGIKAILARVKALGIFSFFIILPL